MHKFNPSYGNIKRVYLPKLPMPIRVNSVMDTFWLGISHFIENF